MQGMKSKFDLNALKRLANPQAVKDFDKFLDALPVNVGYNALIAAGIAWVVAGAALLFASTETAHVNKLRTDLLAVEALKPPVPAIEYIPASSEALENLRQKIQKTFKGTTVLIRTEGVVTLSANDSDYYPQFQAAISHFENGGRNWKVSIVSMCAGRECKGAALQADLKVEIARITTPPQTSSRGG